MKKISLIGAGGHCRSVIDLIESKNLFQINEIFDPSFKVEELIFNYKLVGTPPQSPLLPLVLAIGENNAREALFNFYNQHMLLDNLIHSTSYISKYAHVLTSNQIFSNSYIGPGASVGKNNIINTSAILEHEVEIDSHNHIAVNAVILGRVKIGSRCFIGSNSTIKDKVSICSDVIIGANSFVKSSISEPGTYVGIPARKIK